MMKTKKEIEEMRERKRQQIVLCMQRVVRLRRTDALEVDVARELLHAEFAAAELGAIEWVLGGDTQCSNTK